VTATQVAEGGASGKPNQEREPRTPVRYYGQARGNRLYGRRSRERMHGRSRDRHALETGRGKRPPCADGHARAGMSRDDRRARCAAELWFRTGHYQWATPARKPRPGERPETPFDGRARTRSRMQPGGSSAAKLRILKRLSPEPTLTSRRQLGMLVESEMRSSGRESPGSRWKDRRGAVGRGSIAVGGCSCKGL